MLVRLPQSLVIAEYFNYDQFGEIVLACRSTGESRPFTGTAIDRARRRGERTNAREQPQPDHARRRTTARRTRRCCDIRTACRSRSAMGSGAATSSRTRSASLGYDFSLYRDLPDRAARTTPPREPAPRRSSAVGRPLRVAAQNTLNFFLTLDTTRTTAGAGRCGGNANLDCRGADADQPIEFTASATSCWRPSSGLDADIIGLNEIENTPASIR